MNTRRNTGSTCSFRVLRQARAFDTRVLRKPVRFRADQGPKRRAGRNGMPAGPVRAATHPGQQSAAKASL